MPWLYVYITDMAKFIEKTNMTNVELEKLLRMSNDVKISIVMGLDSTFMLSDITGAAQLYKKYIKSMILTMRKQDQNIVQANYNQSEVDPEIGDAWIEFNRQFVKIKYFN